MPSGVEISNNALAMIGANSIASFYDNTKEAREAYRQYDLCRKAVLRMHPWTFAVRRETLTTLGATPAFDYSHRLIVPYDFLRLLTILEDTAYRLEGFQLYPTIVCNCEELNIKYVANVDDTDQFDPLFAEALAAYMAWKMSYKLSQSESNRDELYKAYYNLARQAKYVGATENPPGSVEANQWVNSRIEPNQGFVRDPQT